jgi:putative ABC transport system ATP-binding protein
VLADEPTAALDGKSGLEVMELLKELVASTGSATVVVTHDPRILKYADRVCEIENGQFK